MPAKTARASAMRGRRGGRSSRGGRPTPAGTPYPPPRPPTSSTAPPPLPARPLGPALTPYAKKYGALPDARGVADIIAPNKSGYTPTDPITVIRPTKEERLKQTQEDEFQRQFLLRGFNAKDLVNMGTYPDLNAQYNVLTNPVMPMSKLDHWETEFNRLQDDRVLSKIDAKGEHYSLGDGDLGLWVGANPVIWAVLEPVLKLFARYLDSMHTSAWLDAFYCGPRREVPVHLDSRSADEIEKRGPMYTFHFRPPGEQNQAEVQILKRRGLAEISSQIMFGFGNGANVSFTNRPGKRGEAEQWEGVTAMNEPGDWVSTVYATDLLQPLLRNDLSPSERFCEQWNCASVMLHEFGHALRMSEVLTLIKTLPMKELKTIILDEPYLEDDIYAELGYSIEQYIHGGLPIAYVRDRSEETPRLGFFIGSFPKRNKNTAVMHMPLLGGIAALPKQDVHIPIPARHYEKLHQDEFWDYAVRKWGIAMVKPDNEIASVATDLPGQKKDNYTLITGALASPFISDLNRALDAKNEKLQKAISLNRDEREAYIIAEKLAQADRKARDRVKFWKDRLAISQAILKAKEEQDEAWNAINPVNLIPAQRKLLNLYMREGRDQATEALAFTKSGVKDERHKSLLVRVNRYLRDLMLDFGDTAKYSWQSKFRTEADELSTMLNITFMILAGKYSGVQDPEVTIEEEEKRLNAAAAPLEIVLDEADKLQEDTEIATTLKLGIQAAENGNQPRCYNLGHFLFKMFPARPLIRNIGLILMAHDESQQLRSNLCKMGVQRLEDLQTATPEEEAARIYWLNGGRAMLARMGDEKQQLMGSAPCIKRRRSYGSLIDEPPTEEKSTNGCTSQ